MACLACPPPGIIWLIRVRKLLESEHQSVWLAPRPMPAAMLAVVRP